jgi:hypothetical protein
MKEVLTKGFWRDVKKTFHDALEGQPAQDHAPQAPADGDPKNSSTPEIQPPAAATSSATVNPPTRHI